MSNDRGLPEYNYETASEAERWAYDQGRDDALNPQDMDLEDVKHALEVCVEAISRIIREGQP
ncbi:hypothetical protein E1218_13105 [Kribbella turkmenica]|uniref:HEPN domain-containing protein n=1 Tax=Kribbella turkmenica TaxID=2530375 RepID=A0A4V2YGC8_9ACTN|nr:hypothetical protein [Kribbella turkmenica]TDD26547.1 hypothetical protein E1218_13105 [Kribbella turkmenica]